MKIITATILMLTSMTTAGQMVVDTTIYHGIGKPRLEQMNPTILVVVGDSICNYLTKDEVRGKLSDESNLEIINDPDSIESFIKDRIKAVLIIRKKEKDGTE